MRPKVNIVTVLRLLFESDTTNQSRMQRMLLMLGLEQIDIVLNSQRAVDWKQLKDTVDSYGIPVIWYAVSKLLRVDRERDHE
jgi:hypothetical protein